MAAVECIDGKPRHQERDSLATQHEVLGSQSDSTSSGVGICPTYKGASPSNLGFDHAILSVGQMYGLETPDNNAGIGSFLAGLALGKKGKAAEEAAKLAANIANKQLLEQAIGKLNGELKTLQILRQADVMQKLKPFIDGVGGLLYGNPLGWAAGSAAQRLRAAEQIDPLHKNRFAALLDDVGKAYDKYIEGLGRK